MKILLALILLTVVAQVPSCGSQGDEGPIVGYVEEKYLLTDRPGPAQPAIMIVTTEYIVPWNFYREVHIGDLVKFENGRWIIVKKASGTGGTAGRFAGHV